MKKIMMIDNMTCSHCSGRVEKALNGIDGVHATVDLESKSAQVDCAKGISDEALKKAVVDARYEVISIK